MGDFFIWGRKRVVQIGMMNDPARDPVQEVVWAREHDFEFIDLTVEGPAAGVETLEIGALRDALGSTGLHIVGHTAWYLPFGSPVPQLRRGATEAVRAIFEPMATLGCKAITVHVDRGLNAFAYDDTVRWNAESFATLAEDAAPYGITIMIENVPNNLNNAKAIRVMLNEHPALRFHLDIAHANVKGERTQEFLKAHADKLVHVHVSDNKRTQDDHLPLGVGTINWPKNIGYLKRSGYDGTITLEVFGDEREFLLNSKERLRALWDAVDMDAEEDE
jgi:sugar phosphate isomerase/epimerase